MHSADREEVSESLKLKWVHILDRRGSAPCDTERFDKKRLKTEGLGREASQQ